MHNPEIIDFPRLQDNQAFLTVAENGNIPFDIQRVFYLTGIDSELIRGEHAHKSSRQLLVAIQGKIEVRLESTSGTVYEFVLDQEDKALYIPPLFWGRIIFSAGAIGLGMASDNFSEEDYIRDYDEFKSIGS